MNLEHEDTKRAVGGNGNGGDPRDDEPPRTPSGDRFALFFAAYLGAVLLLNMARRALESGGRVAEAMQALLLLAIPILVWQRWRRR